MALHHVVCEPSQRAEEVLVLTSSSIAGVVLDVAPRQQRGGASEREPELHCVTSVVQPASVDNEDTRALTPHPRHLVRTVYHHEHAQVVSRHRQHAPAREVVAIDSSVSQGGASSPGHAIGAVQRTTALCLQPYAFLNYHTSSDALRSGRRIVRQQLLILRSNNSNLVEQ